jgi:hypothetical protein
LKDTFDSILPNMRRSDILFLAKVPPEQIALEGYWIRSNMKFEGKQGTYWRYAHTSLGGKWRISADQYVVPKEIPIYAATDGG